MPDELRLSAGPFDGPTVFADRLREAFAAAADRAWPALWCADARFADWPLGEAAVIQALQAWAGSARRLRLVMRDDRLLRERHPRFVAWRQRWDHIIECRICADRDAADLPSGLWTPGWTVERHDPVLSRGSSSGAQAAVESLRHRMDDAFARGRPGFPASILGL
ncbi:MAG: hypothetical protein ACLGJD_25280 [Gammaproteobacteria bacterium]|uniref:hypothetical protein n=1 Tax=Pseudacidovorax sp. TaxID=1934311 RepID=UPI001B4B33EF|nr:hypothetical protein [Pseudacidovorax sp.]MBP6896365.1 hypothetical protein [Pseudacidovorax sp.]